MLSFRFLQSSSVCVVLMMSSVASEAVSEESQPLNFTPAAVLRDHLRTNSDNVRQSHSHHWRIQVRYRLILLEGLSLVISKYDARGIGLACTHFLLEKFSARVVAVSRTRSPALDELEIKHKDNLTIIQGDVYRSSSTSQLTGA